jgi:hypothetical protein
MAHSRNVGRPLASLSAIDHCNHAERIPLCGACFQQSFFSVQCQTAARTDHSFVSAGPAVRYLFRRHAQNHQPGGAVHRDVRHVSHAQDIHDVWCVQSQLYGTKSSVACSNPCPRSHQNHGIPVGASNHCFATGSSTQSTITTNSF